MGTRHLTKVIDSEGITRVAQYGQWDGYPDYTGTRILDFIKEHKMLDKIDKSLAKAYFATKEEIEKIYSGYEFSDDGLWTFEEADRFGVMYPSLTRDTGCDILRVLVYSNGTIPLQDESQFEDDDLFCEGVYTIDFKERTYTTKWNGFEESFNFESLPTAEDYLNAFKTEQVMA
jgi:hypothetical protein